MQAVILAAGKGTRLRPVTADRSKAMVPVLGRPLVERAIQPFVGNGIRDFIFVVSADDTEIRAYFRNQTSPDIAAEFVVQDQRLGMAHALGLAAPSVRGRFVVSSCDSLVSRDHVRDLLSAADEPDAVLSLLDVEPELVCRSGVVALDGGRVRRIVEKPSIEDAPSRTVSLPHYVFSPRVLDYLSGIEPSPRGEYEIQDAIQGLIDGGGNVVGVRAAERTQVSSPEDLLALTQRVFADDPRMQDVRSTVVGRRTRLQAPVCVESGVEIGAGCEIGPGAFLENGCRIGDGAVVQRSIVLRGGRVGERQVIANQVIT